MAFILYLSIAKRKLTVLCSQAVLQQMHEDAIPFLFSRESFNLSQCLFSSFFVAAFDDLPSSSSLSAAALKTERRAGCSTRPKKGSSSSSSFLLRAPPPLSRSRKQAGLEEKSASSSPEKTTFDAGSAADASPKKSRKVKSACLKVENLS